MGFRNIVLPEGQSANPMEDESTNQIPERGKFSEIEVGAGGKTFKMDERGHWMGSDDFETAPYSVDMNGNIKVRASSTNQDISFSFYDEDGNLAIFIGFEDV